MNKLALLCAAVAVATIGCKKRPERLVSEAELRVLDKHASKYFAAAKARRCLRPTLTGRSLEGSADKAIVAIVEATGVVDVKAIVHAVAHENACSPYAPGRRGFVSARIDHINRAVVAEAKTLAPGPAMDLLLQAIRFTHDLSRGGGSLIAAADAAVHTKPLTDALHTLVTRKHTPPADLKRVEHWLTNLIETQPTAHVLVSDELYMTLLDRVLPLLKPTNWEPPGGWPRGVKPTLAPEHDDAALQVFKSDRDLFGLRWLAIRAELAAAARVCPAKATIRQCAEGLAKMAAHHDKLLQQLGRQDLRELVRTAGRAEVVRSNAIDSLRETIRPDYKTSLRDLAAAAGRLAALREVVRARLKRSE